MNNPILREIPYRSKLEMMRDIIKILEYLHSGHQKEANLLIEALKARSIALDPEVQQAVLMFVEQVQFQYAYDPWHTISEEVRVAADYLIGRLFIRP